MLRLAHSASTEMCSELLLHGPLVSAAVQNSVPRQILPSTGHKRRQRAAPPHFWYLARGWRWIRGQSLTLPQSGRLRSVMFACCTLRSSTHSTSRVHLFSFSPNLNIWLQGSRELTWTKRVAGADPNTLWIILEMHTRGFMTTNGRIIQVQLQPCSFFFSGCSDAEKHLSLALNCPV